MWTTENRVRYDRSHLRYPSDPTDDEWALVRPLIPRLKPDGNKRTRDMRDVVDALMDVLSTGCQWRAIPKDLPPRSTVYDYFDLWDYDGTLQRRGVIAGEPSAVVRLGSGGACQGSPPAKRDGVAGAGC